MENNIQHDKEIFQLQKEQFKKGEISADTFKEAQNEIIRKYGKIEQITQKAIWNILVLPKGERGETYNNMFTILQKSKEHEEGRETEGYPLFRAVEEKYGILHILFNQSGNIDCYDWSPETFEKKKTQGEHFKINAGFWADKNYKKYLKFVNKFTEKDIDAIVDLSKNQQEFTVVKVEANQRQGIKVSQELADILGNEVLPSYGKTKDELTLLEENDLLIKEQNDRGYFYRVGAFEAKQTYELGEEAFENLGFLQKFDYLKNQLQQQPLEKIQYDQETDSIKIKDKFSIKRDGDCIVKQIGDTSITNIDRHVILNKLKSIIEKKGEEEKILHEERLKNTEETDKELDDL